MVKGTKGMLKASGIEWVCTETNPFVGNVQIKTKQVPVQEYWINEKDLTDSSVINETLVEKKDEPNANEILQGLIDTGFPIPC